MPLISRKRVEAICWWRNMNPFEVHLPLSSWLVIDYDFNPSCTVQNECGQNQGLLTSRWQGTSFVLVSLFGNSLIGSHKLSIEFKSRLLPCHYSTLIRLFSKCLQHVFKPDLARKDTLLQDKLYCVEVCLFFVKTSWLITIWACSYRRVALFLSSLLLASQFTIATIVWMGCN